MSYALGSKLVPGQHNLLIPDLPSPQRLIEPGLPYAPYIEHGSWATGRPDIARYGRDPYRGLAGGLGQMSAEEEAREEGRRLAEEARRVIRDKLPLWSMTATGTVAGLAGGIAGGLLSKTWLGAIAGAALGGVVGYGAGSMIQKAAAAPQAPNGTGGLAGVLAVL